VGLPLAVEAAKKGFQVVAIDRNKNRVDMINRGKNYIHDVLDDDLKMVVRENRLKAFQDFKSIADSDVVIICVPTPLDKHKVPVITFIEDAVDASLPYIKKGQLYVLESTTYPGTTEEIILPRIEGSGLKVGEDFFLAYSPERIDPGNRDHHVGNILKVVGGVTPKCTQVAKALYEEITTAGIFTMSSPKAAEMEKLLENIFRIVNISLVNEIAILCDKMGIDIWEVIEAAKTKPYGFMPFYPGPGTGGHCIPLDPFYLSWKANEYDITTRFIKLAGEINDGMPQYIATKTAEILNEMGKCLRGSRILILGVAYKKNLGDVRESPAIKVARLLRKEGIKLSYHDPFVPRCVMDGVEYHSIDITPDVVRSSDLVLIATDHSNVDYDMVVKNARAIYDTRNALRNYSSNNIYKLGALGAK
jgi:UDP-N-acetyl-D-glucosamine dehydrogenase